MLTNKALLTCKAGGEVQMDVLVYEPPRQGPTVWEIGIPDRTAGEFYVPDPYPTLMNRLYINQPAEKLVTRVHHMQSHIVVVILKEISLLTF